MKSAVGARSGSEMNKSLSCGIVNIAALYKRLTSCCVAVLRMLQLLEPGQILTGQQTAAALAGGPGGDITAAAAPRPPSHALHTASSQQHWKHGQ